jgi:uncharacterized membrane protein
LVRIIIKLKILNIMRSENPNKFFSDKEKEEIIEAIRQAENQTSGEIRLHLEKKSKGNIFEQAVRVFRKIGMEKTARRNGVLIYLATTDHKFVILGDQSINEVVPENFWQDIAELMGRKFKQNNFSGGLSEGIALIGEKLKSHFPVQTDDVNELPNDISMN